MTTAPVSEGRVYCGGRRDVSAFPLRRNLSIPPHDGLVAIAAALDRRHTIIERPLAVTESVHPLRACLGAQLLPVLHLVCGWLVHLKPPVLGTLTRHIIVLPAAKVKACAALAGAPSEDT